MTQEEKEQWQLQHALLFELADPIRGQIIRHAGAACEVPDYIVETSQGRVGLELTEAIDPRAAAARSDARRLQNALDHGEDVELPEGAWTFTDLDGKKKIIYFEGAFRTDKKKENITIEDLAARLTYHACVN